jgi:hypothetical protein
MFKKWMDDWQRKVKKSLLAERIRDRGVCPEHGCQMSKTFLDNPFGQISHYMECDQCREALEELKVEAKHRHESETEAMLKEYREL